MKWWLTVAAISDLLENVPTHSHQPPNAAAEHQHISIAECQVCHGEIYMVIHLSE